ncbi:MAG: hypothetical protein AB7P20_26160 [Rhizobiaceae bacterium]
MSASPLFDKVCDMEDPIRTVADIVTGLCLIAEIIGDENIGSVVQRLGWLAKDQCTVLETMRCELAEMVKAVEP